MPLSVSLIKYSLCLSSERYEWIKACDLLINLAIYLLRLYDKGGKAVERKSFQLGDIVQMKKNHPCGSNEMEIIRMGMDIRIKCVGCKHSVLVPRAKFEKNMRKVLRPANPLEQEGGEDVADHQ